MVPELRNGFNAIGFSQGGLFLRAYVENCNNPRVMNLVTVIPAQYFKTRTNPTAYLAKSIFLPHINDEIIRNQTHESNIASLDSLILVQFESAHFGYYKAGNKSEIVKLINQDWLKDGVLGLKLCTIPTVSS